MASDKMKEIIDMSVEELNDKLVQLEVDFNDSKFDHATMGMENPLLLRAKRRDIARIKTLLRQRELTNMTPEELEKRSKIVHRRKKRR